MVAGGGASEAGRMFLVCCDWIRHVSQIFIRLSCAMKADPHAQATIRYLGFYAQNREIF
jgi:hypothetical protein